MVEIVYRVLLKNNQEDAFKNLAEEVLIAEARKISGCIQFSLFQNITNEREFIFYEKWSNKTEVERYKASLIRILGNPKPGEEFPQKMNDLIEEDEDLEVRDKG